MISMWYLILVSQYCAMNYDGYSPGVEEPSQVKEMRCIRSQFTCFDQRGEDFCTKVMESSE